MAACLDLTNRVAVVIGATSGIGRAIAVGLRDHGAHIVPTGRRLDEIRKLCCDLNVTVDVTERGSVDRLRDAVLQQYGGIDILVNAAGYTFKQPTVSISEEQWTSLMNTNLNGALRACQSFYEPLKASGRGRIINIGSLGSMVAFHEVAAYCASKSALVSLTRSLAIEWAKDKISVNAILPGVFPTAMNGAIVNDTPRGKEMLMRTPMQRFGRPEELVGAAVLLASDGASFLTGQCIAVDGGYLASGVNS